MYRRIYDVLNTENMLPNPCDITILPPDPPPPETPENVAGRCWQSERKIWFRYSPPLYIHFAHELIHLIPGKRLKYGEGYETSNVGVEEFYAYNLSAFIVELAERGVKPPVNPARLFDIDNTNIILETIREVYNYEFKDLIEFFEWLGVIPNFLKPRDDGLGYEYDPAYPEEAIARATIVSLIDGTKYDEREFQVLVRLLDKLSSKQLRQGDVE